MGDESDDVKSSLWVSRKYRQYLSWPDFPRTQSLRQSLRANVLLGGTTPALRELEGRQTGRDWQEVPWVTALMNDELLHWPLLYKVPWITVVGSSAGDHSVIKKLFGRLVGNVVPGTSHQREKGRENVPTICLCFLSSAGQNLLPGELTLPRMQAVSLAPAGATGEADLCVWPNGLLGWKQLRLSWWPLGRPGRGELRDWEEGKAEEIWVNPYDIADITPQSDKSRDTDTNIFFWK